MVQKDVAIFMIYRAFETKQYGNSAFLHSLNTDWKIITFLYHIPLLISTLRKSSPINYENIILLERHNDCDLLHLQLITLIFLANPD